MTNYNLQDFKNWLNTNPDKKRNLTLWDDYFEIIGNGWHGNDIASFAYLHEYIADAGGELEDTEVQKNYREVLKEWMQEKDNKPSLLLLPERRGVYSEPSHKDRERTTKGSSLGLKGQREREREREIPEGFGTIRTEKAK